MENDVDIYSNTNLRYNGLYIGEKHLMGKNEMCYETD